MTRQRQGTRLCSTSIEAAPLKGMAGTERKNSGQKFTHWQCTEMHAWEGGTQMSSVTA